MTEEASDGPRVLGVAVTPQVVMVDENVVVKQVRQSMHQYRPRRGMKSTKERHANGSHGRNSLSLSLP